MKKLIWIVSVLLVPAIAKTQHFSASFKISMNPPEIIDVVLILDDATLGFNRQDIIEAFQKFKKDYELKQYELTNFEEAVAMLEKQKEKIKVDDVKTQKSEHVFLSQLLYMRVAANLLLAGKAEVIRKSSKEPEIEITWRQLLPGLNEGSLYKFSFTDGQEFYVGRQFGIYITEGLFVRDTVDRNTQQIQMDDSNKVFYAVEVQPMPLEGIDKFMREYLPANVKYTPAMIKEGLEGKVFVKFIVNTDGSLANIEIMKGLHPSFDKEAIRVVKKSGPWKSGMQSGKFVRSQFVVPVYFKLPTQ